MTKDAIIQSEIFFQYEVFIIIDINDKRSLKLPMAEKRNLAIIKEELSKHNCKRVFISRDEPVLKATSSYIDKSTGKNFFISYDKVY
jgi:hypothetical protein